MFLKPTLFFFLVQEKNTHVYRYIRYLIARIISTPDLVILFSPQGRESLPHR